MKQIVVRKRTELEPETDLEAIHLLRLVTGLSVPITEEATTPAAQAIEHLYKAARLLDVPLLEAYKQAITVYMLWK